MNHSVVDKEKSKVMEYPICQFYIVLGKHEREFKNTKKNKYFFVTGNEDLKLIQYAVNSEYKKKKKEGYAVAGEIIFLIPTIDDRSSALELMEQLNFKGRVKIVPPLKKKEVVPPVEEISEKKVEKNLEVQEEKVEDVKAVQEKDIEVKEPAVNDKEKNVVVNEDTFEVERVISVKNHDGDSSLDVDKDSGHVIPEPQVFHRDVEFPSDKVMKKTASGINSKNDDVASYMWGDEEDSKLLTKKKIDLPVIVFVISALLFIGAIVLLFVLK